MNFEELILLVDDAVYRHHQKHLRDIDVLVLRESLHQKSYDQIADENNYTGQYLRQDVGPKLWNILSAALDVKIAKKNCATALKTFWQAHKSIVSTYPQPAQRRELDSKHLSEQPQPSPAPKGKVDWGHVSAHSVFYGREPELVQLQQWVQSDDVRLVSLTGMGGMGKTTLACKLTELLQPHFEFVMVRTMRNAPKLSSILSQFFNFVGVDVERSASNNIDVSLRQLMTILRQHRCLLVFDNVETLLQEHVRAGKFSPRYEDYGQLFQQIADQSHQSCLIITSREIPKDIGLRDSLNAPVKNLRLSGLQLNEAQLILQHKGLKNVDIPSLQEILSHYAGNPLALKIVAAGILELGQGDLRSVVPFLQRGILQFEDIDDLLGRQFQRLDDIERQVMYWLALHREPMSLMQLEQDILRFNILKQLPRAIQSLNRRSLLERNDAGVFLQPVVMEYVTQRFLESLAEEMIQGQYVLLQTYALLNTQAKDYIREAQQRFILEPLLARLMDALETVEAVKDHFLSFLERLRIETPRQPSYACGNLLNLLRQLNGNLDHLNCSNLSVWKAYLSGLSINDINFSQADLSRSVFSHVLSTTLSVCFSPNGQFFATANADNNIRVWTVKDCKEHQTYKGHRHWVSSVTFCPESQLLMSGSFDKTIKLWDLETGLCLQTLEGHTGWIWAVVCSPADQNIIASCSDDHTIRIWNRQTGECLQVLDDHKGAVWSLAFSPNGKYLASAASDVAASVKLWTWETGEHRDLIPVTLERRVRSVDFSPDGKFLVTGSLTCITEVWDVETGDLVQQFRGHAQAITSVAFAPKRDQGPQLLATGSQDCNIRLWDLETGTSIHTLRGHPNGIWALAFHPTQPLLISGSNDSTVKLWDTNSGESVRTLQGYSTGIKALAIHPDGTQLASAGDNSLICLWDTQTHEQCQTLAGHSSWVWALAYAFEGQALLSGGNDNVIKLWDLETGHIMRDFIGHRSLIFSLAVHDDTARLASASDDHTVCLWDLQTGQCLQILDHGGRVWSVDFSPDGRLMACGHCETLINIWDVQSHELLCTLEEHTSLTWTLAFSPDGQLLASGSDDTTAKLWDVTSQTCRYTLEEHSGSIWAIAFSPGGDRLATGSNDHTVCIWSVESGALLHTMYGHESAIWDVAFRSDSELVSASQEGTLKFWNLDTGECTATLRDTRPYEGMNLTETTGLTEAQKMSLVTLGAIL